MRKPKPRVVRPPLDVPKMFKLWADNELTKTEIARQLGITEGRLDLMARKYALPDRGRKHRAFSMDDPTPEEIELRARECREKHFAQRRTEPYTPSKHYA